jgi:hypothetical protein
MTQAAARLVALGEFGRLFGRQLHVRQAGTVIAAGWLQGWPVMSDTHVNCLCVALRRGLGDLRDPYC